jgi:hypothetical protein
MPSLLPIGTLNKYIAIVEKIMSEIFRGKKLKLSLCLTNQALHHEGVWGSGCIDPRFLDLESS